MQTVRGAGGLQVLFHPDSWSSDLTLPNFSPILFNTLSVAKLFWLWRKEVKMGTKNFISCEHFSTWQGSKCCTDGMFKYWNILRITVKSIVGAICFALLHRLYLHFFAWLHILVLVPSLLWGYIFTFISSFGHLLYTLFFHLIFISGFHVMYMCIYKIDQICIHVPLRCKKYPFCTGFFRSTRSWSKLRSKWNLTWLAVLCLLLEMCQMAGLFCKAMSHTLPRFIVLVSLLIQNNKPPN